jgi:hypothetical protein
LFANLVAILPGIPKILNIEHVARVPLTLFRRMQELIEIHGRVTKTPVLDVDADFRQYIPIFANMQTRK